MKKKDGNGLTLEQQRELCSALAQAAPTDMPRDVYEGWMTNRRALNKVIRRAVLPSTDEEKITVIDANPLIGQFAEEWGRLYRDKFGLTIDFSRVRVPTIPTNFSGFNWLMFVAKELTPNAVYAVCESMFPCYQYTLNLDAAVKDRNDREPNESYAIWLRDRVEPDEELKNLSANQLAAYGVVGNTLLEALLLESWYFKRTGGEHLNVANWNLCSGSRFSDGHVPNVHWYGVKFQVDWSFCDCANATLRARAAVS